MNRTDHKLDQEEQNKNLHDALIFKDYFCSQLLENFHLLLVQEQLVEQQQHTTEEKKSHDIAASRLHCGGG